MTVEETMKIQKAFLKKSIARYIAARDVYQKSIDRLNIRQDPIFAYVLLEYMASQAELVGVCAAVPFDTALNFAKAYQDAKVALESATKETEEEVARLNAVQSGLLYDLLNEFWHSHHDH